MGDGIGRVMPRGVPRPTNGEGRR